MTGIKWSDPPPHEAHAALLLNPHQKCAKPLICKLCPFTLHAIYYQVARSRVSGTKRLPWPFWPPCVWHRSRPIEVSSDSYRFVGDSGLPAVRRFNAGEVTKGCTVAPLPCFFCLLTSVTNSRKCKWFWFGSAVAVSISETETSSCCHCLAVWRYRLKGTHAHAHTLLPIAPFRGIFWQKSFHTSGARVPSRPCVTHPSYMTTQICHSVSHPHAAICIWRYRARERIWLL